MHSNKSINCKYYLQIHILCNSKKKPDKIRPGFIEFRFTKTYFMFAKKETSPAKSTLTTIALLSFFNSAK